MSPCEAPQGQALPTLSILPVHLMELTPQHACLLLSPAVMARDLPSAASNPHLNAFLYLLPWLWCLITAKEALLRQLGHMRRRGKAGCGGVELRYKVNTARISLFFHSPLFHKHLVTSCTNHFFL